MRDIGGAKILVFDANGPPVRGERDAVDLIGEAFGAGATWAAIPVERLGEDFFDLSNRIAGEAIQKFVTYQVGLAVVGDITSHLARSGALRDFVYESNNRRHVWFVSDLAELEARLGGA